MDDRINKTFKIIFVWGMVVFGVMILFFGLIYSDRGNGGGVVNVEQETQPQTQERKKETIEGRGGGVVNVEQETQPQTQERKKETIEGRGDVLEYYDDGTLKSNYSVNSDGEGVFVFYHDNGNRKEERKGTFRNNELYGQGEIISYAYNGLDINSRKKGHFISSSLNGQGEYVVYYVKLGRVHPQEWVGTFFNDVFIQGQFIRYHMGDKIEEKGRFNEKGRLTDGERIYYDENGRIIRKERV